MLLNYGHDRLNRLIETVNLSPKLLEINRILVCLFYYDSKKFRLISDVPHVKLLTFIAIKDHYLVVSI